MRKNMVIVAVVLLVGVFIYNQVSKPRLSKNRVSQEYIDEAHEFIKQNTEKPGQYLVNSFSDKDIVLLGRNYFDADSLEFIIETLPVLYASDVSKYCVDFLLADDQDVIDQFMNSDEFSEETAKALLLPSIVFAGFESNLNFLKVIWTLNNSRSANQPEIKLTGLWFNIDYTKFSAVDEKEWDTVYLELIPGKNTFDSYMAEKAFEAIGSSGDKVLIIALYKNVFTHFTFESNENDLRRIGFPEDKLLTIGNYLYNKFGDKTFSIFIHSFIEDLNSPVGVDFPDKGIIETVIQSLEDEYRKFGLTISGSIFEYNEVIEFLAGERENIKLADIYNGYISLGSFGELSTVKPISGLVNADTLEEVQKTQKTKRWKELTVEDIIRGIDAEIEQYNTLRTF